jgi:hypothetical protein
VARRLTPATPATVPAMPKLIRVALVAALALSLVATGCGTDNKQKNAYVDAVNKAQTDFSTTFDKLSSRITSTSTPHQDRQTLQGFEDAIGSVVRNLRAVKAPASVKPLHQRLITEIAGYGAEIATAKKAFASRSASKIVKAQTDLVSAVTAVSAQINKTIDQINTKLRT